MGELVGHFECIAEDCASSDAMAVYLEEDGTCNAHCFSCNTYQSHNKLVDSHISDQLRSYKIDMKRSVGKTMLKIKKKDEEDKVLKPEKKKEIFSSTSHEGGGYRGIKDETFKLFGVRNEVNKKGEVVRQYYPVTKDVIDGKPNLVGFKCRITETKDFLTYGLNSKTCDLFGQWRCKGGKWLMLVEGELDALSAHQIFEEYRNGRDNIAKVDVISTSIGATAYASQVRNNYDIFEKYDNVVLCMDNDTAGEKALEELVDVISHESVRIMLLPTGRKDANDMLMANEQKEFVRAFYSSMKPKIAGISDANDIVSSMMETTQQKRIPLPKFMESVNKALGGGYAKSGFQIISAFTSVGKTSCVNEIIFHFLENKMKVGLLSLEASKGYVGEQLTSLLLNTRFANIYDVEKKAEIVKNNEDKILNFMTDEDGDSNLYILDDRTYLEDIDSIFTNLKKLIKVCRCEIIVIDVLSDLTDTMTIEAQAEFMGRIKKLVAGDEVCVIGVMHMRKPSDRRDPHDVSEFDIYGSSTAVKSAQSVILLSRDKMSDCEIERNTVKVKLTKNRLTGRTGSMGDIFFDSKSGRLLDASTIEKNEVEENNTKKEKSREW